MSASGRSISRTTVAVCDGGDYVITGHKWFASSAGGARFAIVIAVTDPAAPPHAPASQIIVLTEALATGW